NKDQPQQQPSQPVASKPTIKLPGTKIDTTGIINDIGTAIKLVDTTPEMKTVCEQCVGLGQQFLSAFAEYKDFYHWCEDVDSVQTDFFSQPNVNRDVHKKALYDVIVYKIKNKDVI